MSSFRTALLFLCTAIVVTPLGARQAVPQYGVAGTLPDVVNGQALTTFAFDPGSNRLYAGARTGLYYADTAVLPLRMQGPLIKKSIFKIEIAADLGRMFYSTAEEVGFVDLRPGATPVAFAKMGATDMVYEPTRHEIYVASRAPKMFVFDARTGKISGSVALPGWFGHELEAVPGRVFFQAGGKDGLYSIDPETRAVAPWPVKGTFVTPASVNADPTGRYLFAAYGIDVVAIDVATATVSGRVKTDAGASIAYDRSTGLLMAAWPDRVKPIVNLAAFRPGADGLVEVARLESPGIGLVGLERGPNGFIQSAVHGLLVWSSQRTKERADIVHQ